MKRTVLAYLTGPSLQLADDIVEFSLVGIELALLDNKTRDGRKLMADVGFELSDAHPLNLFPAYERRTWPSRDGTCETERRLSWMGFGLEVVTSG